jgi:hypothetical protein
VSSLGGLVVLLVFSRSTLHAESPTGVAKRPEPQWIRTGTSDGIATFKRDVPGSDVIALRGEGVVDAPIVRVTSVLLDYDRASEWIDSLEEARLIRILPPNEFIEYDHLGTPPLFADRDFVCRGRIEVDARQQTFAMNLWPATDPAVPVGSYVRGTLRGYWKFRAIDNGKKTHVIAEMNGDPKGNIPKWLVNFFQSDWPHNTLMSLRAQVAKRDIRILPQVPAVFRGEPLALPVHPSARKR